MTDLDSVCRALETIRAPLARGEYDLHRLAEDALSAAGIPWQHEVPLAPRCRIDLMAGRVGIEIKRGRPERARLREQLKRYAVSAEVDALVLVAERGADLPREIAGKPLRVISLNRLWGIAL